MAIFHSQNYSKQKLMQIVWLGNLIVVGNVFYISE